VEPTVAPAGLAGDADLVTPEAVVLDLPVASIGSRTVAVLIDIAIQGAVLLAIVFAASAASVSVAGWVAVSVAFLTIFTVLFGYPVAFETLWRGRTPGKAAMGLRVVTVEAAPVGFRHAAIRAALAFIEIWATSGGIAVLVALFNRRAQRLGDLAAGTVVIRERSGAGPVEPARFIAPVGAEDYVVRLDVSGLDEDDYLAVRSVLVRRHGLAPAVQEQLAREVAAVIVPRVVPSPPAGMPAAVYLQAVAAAYQHRHAARVAPDVSALLWEQKRSPLPPQGGGDGIAGLGG
jgi:uncharacterized RDD family membrane protein YckC